MYKPTPFIREMLSSTALTDCIKYLHEVAGVDINSIGKSGQTCLHVAVENKNHEVVEYLLTQTSVNTELRDHDGNTAADIANQRGEKKVLALFEKIAR